MEPKKQNYLNNRDILLEILKSKASFSSYKDKSKHMHYDCIVEDLSQIDDETIELAIVNRMKRLGYEKYNSEKKLGNKVKIAECIPDRNTIEKTDLVFRLMTYSHIPQSPSRKKNKKIEADSYVRLNFPPYQHYVFNDQNELECVAKSHWKGDLELGEFSSTHGKMTENLGRMILKIVDRYGQRANWRNYTYVDEMKGHAVLQLSQIGLQFNELKSDNPFSYFTAVLTNAFTRVFNIEKKMQIIRDDILEENGLVPSSTRQNQKEFANEVARQAELYKKIKPSKQEDNDLFAPSVIREIKKNVQQ